MGRVGVPAGDVVHTAVLVDQRDDRPVGEDRHDRLGDPLQCRALVATPAELLDHDGADLGQGAEPAGGLAGHLRGAPALAHVEEVHRQAVGGRPGADLVPGVQRIRVVGLEDPLLTGRGRTAVVGLEVAADGVREQLPDLPADQFGAGALEHLLGAAVDVGEPPVAVEGEEGLVHGLEHPGHVQVGGAGARGVVGGAEQPDGGAALVAEGASAAADPLGGAGREHDPELGVVGAAGVDGVLQRGHRGVEVVGVQPRGEGLDPLAELLAGVPEELQQPVVPVEPAGDEVPVEAADAGGFDGELEAQSLGGLRGSG
jgi:hypothetical protein